MGGHARSEIRFPSRARHEPAEDAIRVLLVEDDPTLRRAFQRLLEELGFEVTPAGSIAEARGALGEPHDVVVCDHRLPDGLGTRFLSEVEGTSSPRPACILLSGEVPADWGGRALLKPVMMHTLERAIRDAVIARPRVLTDRRPRRE